MNTERERGWRALFTGLTEAQRRDVHEILAEDFAAEVRLAHQLAEHAKRLSRFPDLRARLHEIAAREEEHARWLRGAIERLGGRPPARKPSPPDARTNWERLIADLEAEKAALEKYRNLKEGANADYIPALAKVDSNIYGIALVTVDGSGRGLGSWQQRPRLQVDERRGHHQEFAGDIEVQLLHELDHVEVLRGDERDRNVVDVDLVLLDEVQQQIQRSLEVVEADSDRIGRRLEVLRFGHHRR